jgi:hypothetical protein
VTQTITQPISSALDFITNVGGHNSISVIQKGDAIYICCSDTFWTRYIVKPNRQSQLLLTAPTAPIAPVAPGTSNNSNNSNFPSVPETPNPLILIDEATKVFYLEGNLSEFSRNDAAFSKAAANAVLLWEKQ